MTCKKKILFQLDTVTHMHTTLISRFQVHPTEVNLKELFQTKMEGKPGMSSTASCPYLVTG